jgi:hypothetical protein
MILNLRRASADDEQLINGPSIPYLDVPWISLSVENALDAEERQLVPIRPVALQHTNLVVVR